MPFLWFGEEVAVDANGDCAWATEEATVASAFVTSGAPTGSGAGLEARADRPSADFAIPL